MRSFEHLPVAGVPEPQPEYARSLWHGRVEVWTSTTPGALSIGLRIRPDGDTPKEVGIGVTEARLLAKLLLAKADEAEVIAEQR